MSRYPNIIDPIEKTLRTSWNRSKAQARSRNQVWDLSWEDYYYLWTVDGAVYKKGRGSESLMLARKDISAPWTYSNVHLSSRRSHLQRIYTGVKKV